VPNEGVVANLAPDLPTSLQGPENDFHIDHLYDQMLLFGEKKSRNYGQLIQRKSFFK